MNSNLHRVIFNAARGMRMVVHEGARGHSGRGSRRRAGASGGVSAGALPSAWAGAWASAAAVFALLGWPASSMHAQVLRDTTAPGGQQPHVVAAPNGVPVVNITAPTPGGVSRNRYRQFDVDGKGAILNNSRTNVQTQLGGWVQGNPNLGRGPARVILNEVRSTNPSLLHGPVEVGGQRASVIFSNPAGISVNGGTFINASRATLTTGVPVLDGNGALASFRVDGGAVTIDGAGLDASGTDYTAIMARAVQVNAGIWARELGVAAGVNDVSADASQVDARSAGDGAAPAFALDVSHLGGMYAGKIRLVGTEAGVGMRNAGTIGAAAGEVVVTASGRLDNSGTLEAARLALRTGDVLRNSGTLRQTGGTEGGGSASGAGQGGADADGGATDTGAGTSAIYVPPSPGIVRADAGVDNRGGRIIAGGDIALDTPRIDNSGGTLSVGRLSVTGAQFNNAGGELFVREGFSAQVGQFDNSGGKLRAGRLDIDSASDVRNAGGQLLAGAGDARVSAAGTLDNEGGSIEAVGALDARAGEQVRNAGGQLIANGAVNLNADAFDNTQGRIESTQDGAQLTVAGSIANTGGHLSAATDLGLGAGQLANGAGGVAMAGRDATLTVRQELTNDGILRAGRHLAIDAGRLGASDGSSIGAGIAANGVVGTKGDLAIHADQALAAHGTVLAVGEARIDGQSVDLSRSEVAADQLAIEATGGGIDTRRATVASTGRLQMRAQGQGDQRLGNRGGQINAGALEIAADTIDNSAGGRIGQSGAGQATVHAAQALDNAGGSIASNGSLRVAAASVGNTGGVLGAVDGGLRIDATRLDNRAGLISAGGRVDLSADEVANTQTLQRPAQGSVAVAGAGEAADADAPRGIEGDQVRIATDRLANREGAIRANDSLSVQAAAEVDNTGGEMTAGQRLAIEGKGGGQDSNPIAGALAVRNEGGRLLGGGALAINAASLDGKGELLAGRTLDVALAQDLDNAGSILSNGELNLRTEGRLTNSGLIAAAGATGVAAHDIDNTARGEISGADTRVRATGILTNRGLIDGGSTRIEADSFTNIGAGRVYGDRLSVGANSLQNIAETVDGQTASATIAARERLDIGAASIDNRDGALIYSEGAMHIGGALAGDGRASGSAVALANHAATIEAAGDMTLDAVRIDNTNGGVTYSQGQEATGPAQHVLEYAVPGSAQRFAPDEVLLYLSHNQFAPWRSFTATDASDPNALNAARKAYNSGLLVPAPEYPLERFARYYKQSPQHSQDLSYQVIVNPGDAQQVETRTEGGVWYPGDDAIWADFGVEPPPVDMAKTHPGWRDPNITVGQRGVMITVGTAAGDEQQLMPFDHPVTQEEFDQWQAYQQAHARLDQATRAFIDTVFADRSNNAPQHLFSTFDYFDYEVSATTPVLKTSAPARIAAGGDLHIKTAGGSNEMSDILAGGKLSVEGGTIRNDSVQVQGSRQIDGRAVHSYLADHSVKDSERREKVAPYQLTEPFTVSLGAGRIEDRQADLDTARTIDAQAAHDAVPAAPGTGGTPAARPVAPIVEVPVTGGDKPAADTGAAAPAIVRTSTPDAALPTASLFGSPPEGLYLVETDPRFANYRQWLSSDYLLRQLGHDPATVQKRLGDGYYEQRLIREQVAKLTGYRYLEGYSNDEAQYQALMTSGATFAQQFQLTPGVALSAAQMAQLTSDIVWLVEQTVTAADGSQQKVLVPQLYVRVRPGDIDGSGALLSGDEVRIDLGGDAQNKGNIAGRQLVQINARNVHNLDGGTIAGRRVKIEAQQDVQNLGATVRAQELLDIRAGQDVVVASTVTQAHTRANAGQSTSQLGSQSIDRIAGLYVTGNDGVGGELNVQAQRDATLTGANVNSAGSVAIDAGRDLNVDTVKTGLNDDIDWGSGNSRRSIQTAEAGTAITANGDITLDAGQDINARAARVQSEDGALEAVAGRDVNIVAGEATSTFDGHNAGGDKSLLGRTRRTEHTTSSEARAQGSDFEGSTVYVEAGRDITVRGSDVISDAGTELWAGRDVTLDAATERYAQSKEVRESASGVLTGGLGMTVGKRREDQAHEAQGSRAVGSTLGALTGDVIITAGEHYRQTGSDVTALTGDVDILAKSVDITEARETYSSQDKQTYSQSGVSLGLKAPLLDTLMGMQDTARATQDVSSERKKALGAGSMALSGYETYQGIADAAARGNGTGSPAGLGVSLSIGQSEYEAGQSRRSDTAAGSTITAGNDVRIRATGAGQDSNVRIRGSQVSAGHDATVEADNRIELDAARNTAEQSASSRSSNASIGVTYGLGQDAAGLTLDVAYGQRQDSDSGADTTYSASTIQAGNKATLRSGGDTTIRGSTIEAERVVQRVGGNLEIETLQDSSTYQNRQSGSGVEASFCIYNCSGGGASANSYAFQGEGQYRSATEQAGIRAGDGGFDVQVQGKTTLTGATITSTDKAVDEGLNNFESNGLTLKDLDNRDRFSAIGKSVTVSTSLGGNSAGLGDGSSEQQSTTRSGISGIAGDTEVRTGKDSTNALVPIDKQQVMDDAGAEVLITQQFSQLAPRAAAQVADGQKNRLQKEAEEALRTGDTERAAQLLDEAARWDEGGIYRVAIHTAIGGLIGGGGGALGAGAVASAAPQLNELQYALLKQLIDAGASYEAANLLSKLTTSLISGGVGGLVGGQAGAGSGFAVDANNRRLHPSERQLAQRLAAKANDQGLTISVQDIEEQMRLMGNAAYAVEPNTVSVVQGGSEELLESFRDDPTMPRQVSGAFVVEVPGNANLEIQKFIVDNSRDDSLGSWIPGSSPYISSVPFGETPSLPKEESTGQNRCANLDVSCASGVGVAQNKPLTPAQRRVVAIYFSKVGTNFQRAAAVATSMGNPQLALSFEIAAGVSALLEQSFAPSAGKVLFDTLIIDQVAKRFSDKTGIPLLLVSEATDRYIKPLAQPARERVDHLFNR